MRESERHIEAVAAALSLLDAFVDAPGELRLKELEARTGLNRSRLLRLAGTLEAAGYLQSNGGTQGYALGGKLMLLGRLVSERHAMLERVVRPSLASLAAATGDTAMLSVVRGTHRLLLAREAPDEGICFVAREGASRPLHLGASGRVLLANLPPAEQQALLRAMPEGIADTLAAIRAQGFAVSHGEATPHAFAVAVPLCDGDGRLHGALSLAGPLSKLTEDLAAAHVGQLLQAASALSDEITPTINPGGMS